MSELFPPSFVEGIRRLRVLARDVPHARDAGEHTSRHSGAGIDFRDFRPYAPGDDLRRVDWNAYRRSRRLMTRLYHEPRRLYAHILLDVSESMFFEDPPRADAGRRVAAALAAAAADHHDQVAVYPFGAELAAPIRLGNAGGLANLLAGLERLGPAGATDTRAALRALLGMRARPGLLVLISDFFDPAGTEAIFDELDRLRHRVVLVRLTRSVDRDPPWDGDVELVDCETAAAVHVALDATARQSYAARFAAFEADLQSRAARRRAPLFEIDADAPILPQLERLFIGGALRL